MVVIAYLTKMMASKALSRNRVTTDGVWIGNRLYWTLTLVTTDNCDSLTELHTPKITVITSHIKSSRSLVAVAW
jgi:hypothetical protein